MKVEATTVKKKSGKVEIIMYKFFTFSAPRLNVFWICTSLNMNGKWIALMLHFSN